MSTFKDGSKQFQAENCLNIYWKIKNFSYCWQTIRSPDFSYCGNKYCLQLNPNDVRCEIIFLKVVETYINNRISFRTCDGSEELSKSFCGKGDIQASKNVICGNRRSAFLPKDTLTILCQLEKTYMYNYSSSRAHGNVLFSSQIGVKTNCFMWNLESFKTENKNKNVLVENSDLYGNIQLKLKSVGGINIDEQFFIEILRKGGEKCYCVLKISLYDSNGKAANYVSDEYIFEKVNEELWRFPPIIRNSKLMSCENSLLHNGTLSLKCEFAVTLGKVTNQKAVHSYKADIVPLLKETEELPVIPEEHCSSDLKSDLGTILKDATLCDVRLQIGSNVIPAHKNILGARSPVFKAMFTKDMKETINDTVVIEDIDADTVRRLLHYMYTDSILDIQWENIINLYFAADKYEVLSLKQECSAFLKANIDFLNVCDVLVLAYLYQDLDLKSVVHAFVVKYDSEVFASETWKKLEKNNPPLALQTMREIWASNRLD